MSNQQPDPHVIMDQVRSEMQTAYLQEFLQTVRDTCFDKCITKPSSSMSSGEVTCLARCCDRYLEATKVVSGTIVAAYNQASKSQGGGFEGGGLH